MRAVICSCLILLTFLACPVHLRAQSPVPLYRVDDTAGISHYLTVDPGEYGSLLTSGSWADNVPQGYAYPASGGPAGTVPLYYFWNPSNNDHLFTANPAEIAFCESSNAVVNGGPHCYVLPDGTHGGVPLWRFYNPVTGQHLFTTDLSDPFLYQSGWGVEGISCYVFATSVVSIPGSSFETPFVGANPPADYSNAPADYQNGPSGGPWTFGSGSSGGAGIAGPGSVWQNPADPQGSQVAFVQFNGTLSQSLSGFQAGVSYTLDLLGAQCGYNGGSNKSVQVQLDGNPVGPAVTPSGTAYSLYSTGSLSVTAGTHTLSVVGLGPTSVNNAAFLDDLQLFGRVPPPSVPTLTVVGGVSLTWTASTGNVTGYNIYRLAPGYSDYTLLKSVSANTLTYNDSNAAPTDGYQYEVTGIGPGGESAPSTPVSAYSAEGYIPQPRPGTNPSSDGNPADYDWTGLIQHEVFGHDYNHQHTVYLAANQSQTQKGLGIGLDYELDGEPSASYTASGTSTYKWLWVPPSNDGGLKNDPNKAATDPSQPFPAYPVYMLSKADPYLSFYTSGDAGTSATVSGSIQDGFDSSWSQTQTLPNPTSLSGTVALPANSVDSYGNYIGQLPRRTIQAGMTDSASQSNPAKQIADATLSPYITGSLQSNDYYASLYASLDGFVSPIQMTYPSVFSRPDLGDGQSKDNQFVYNADVPNPNNPIAGILSIPAEIQAPGATTDDLQWLLTPGGPTTTGGPNPHQNLPLVGWAFDQDQNNQVDYPLSTVVSPYTVQVSSPYLDFDNSYFGIIPQTRAQTTDPNSNAAILGAAINFYGLPQSPHGFGNHTVTLDVSTYQSEQNATPNASAEAHFQTFFNGLASNWPGSNGPYNPANPNQPWSPPNWYNYYTLVTPTNASSPQTPYNLWSPFQLTSSPNNPNNQEPATFEVPPSTVVNYSPNNGSSRAYTNNVVEIHNDAYTYPEMRVFDIDPNPLGSNPELSNDPKFKQVDPSTHLVRCVGKLKLQGIYSYIGVTSHELGHIISYNKLYYIPAANPQPGSAIGFESPPFIVNNSVGDPNAPSHKYFDDLWTAWKGMHHLNPYWSDSTNGAAYGPSDLQTGRLVTTVDQLVNVTPNGTPILFQGDAADDEILADLPAVAALFENDPAGDNVDAWQYDWADEGINRAKNDDGTYGGAPYFRVQQPSGLSAVGQSAPTFYLRFVPILDGHPTNGATAFTNGGGPLSDGSYPIRNLGDLTAQYPNLVTSIEGLGP